jgi:hypothetical protein
MQIENITLMNNIMEIQEDAEKRHREVLDMIKALSDTTSSDGVSFVRNALGIRNQKNDFYTDKQGLFGLLQQVSFHWSHNNINP